MAKITTAQMRKIYALAKEKGLDNEILHDYVRNLTSKSSLKHLSIREAITVIDTLSGKTVSTGGMITFKQQHYIEGMAKKLGWLDDEGKLHQERLGAWLYKKYGISHIGWLTAKKASDAIEGLKAMLARETLAEQKAI